MVHASHRERGDAGVIALILVLLLLISGGAYWLWYKNQHNGNIAALSICSTLSLSQGSSEGAAGTIYKHAVITNTGTTSCVLAGYPAVFMLGGGGTQVGAGAAVNSLYPVTNITLAPGGEAHAIVAYPQQANFPAGECSAIGSTMKLYVPGTTTALTAPWSDYSCPGFSATALQAGS